MEPWPTDAAKLSRGVNDTWNAFQRFNAGRSVTVEEWKAARQLLWEEQELQRAQQRRCVPPRRPVAAVVRDNVLALI